MSKCRFLRGEAAMGTEIRRRLVVPEFLEVSISSVRPGFLASPAQALLSGILR